MTSDKKLNSSLSQKLKRKSGGSPKKGKKGNPWSDSEEDGSVSDGNLSDVLDDAPVIPREKAAGSRRAAANIKFDKYNSDESEEEEESDEEMFDNSGIAEAKSTNNKMEAEDSDDEEEAAPKKQATITDSFKPKAKKAQSDNDDEDSPKKNGNGITNGKGDKDEFDVSDSGSDFEGGFAKKAAKKVPVKKAPAKKKEQETSDDLFDSMMSNEKKSKDGDGDKKAVKKAPAKKKP